MESSNPLLRRYRSDRRKLLEFLLSSGLIKEITTPEGPTTTAFSNIEFDSLSTDYVIECIRTGGVLDVSQAAKKYHDDSSHPITRRLQSRDVFYLCSDPDSAGSPPHRVPPPITMNQRETKRNVAESCNSMDCEEATAPYTNSLLNTNILSVGLPTLKTGLRDDDLRESAYEVLLGSMMFSRFEILPTEVRKREKSPKFLSGLKSRKEKRHIEPESSEKHLKLLDTIRIQMQISVAADELIRRRLTQYTAGKACRQFDVPQLSLVLLTGLLKSDFPSEKPYLYWKNRQANILEELVCSDHKKTEKQMIEASLAKIRNPTEWDVKMSPSERSNVLLTLRQVALTFSSLPERFGLEGETYYWTSGYHLNIRLYEKLLFGVFDILEEGQFIEEAEEILKFVKLTWSMLGITDRLHHALFAWVLFQQFVATEEVVLLDYAIREVEHVLTAEVYDDKELAYIKSLQCSNYGNGCESRMNLLQSIFSSIGSWCDNKLQDYHLHFSQKPSFFGRVLTMGLSTTTRDFIPHGHIQFTGSCLDEIATKTIRNYVEKTLDAACERVSGVTTMGSTKDRTHPLAILAGELKLIAEKDLTIFSPVLSRWYPDCAMVSAKTLHQFYGARLKPFIKDITCFTEDVRKVLPAAYELEHCLIKLSSSACKENNFHHDQGFERYPIAEVSKSIILDWVVAQHERILEWTGRAFDLEDWEPLSSQQKHAASAVEVFRIIEETVHQFFEWSLPMDITHLQALLSVIFHSLDAYLTKVVSQLVDKQKLYPSTPPLTRYKETTFPIVKKKVVVESFIMDDDIYKHLDELTASKLCIRLNTYKYIQKQIAGLEEGIMKSWVSVASYRMDRHSTERNSLNLEPGDVNGESVSELFVATLDCIRDSASHAIRKTSEFLGAKIVFWDMRDSFLTYLYYGGVEGNRLDGVLPQFDKVLNDVCGVIDNTIRDLVVSSIWKASLEGFMWVLLDGGPSRAFSDTDISLIDEDFNMLKDLFVADGEGLPRSLVEEQAKSYRQILSLFSLQSESLIRMLMASSEQISAGINIRSNGQRYMGDAHTLIRVLCHKKDREASRFLKRQYRLPSSSDYGESGAENSSLGSPFVADILKKSASFRWSEKSQSSFRSLRKRFQETTWR